MEALEDIIYAEILEYSKLTDKVHIGYYDEVPKYTIPITTILLAHYILEEGSYEEQTEEINRALTGLWEKGLVEYEFFVFKEDPQFLFIHAIVLTARQIAKKCDA